MIEEGSIAFKIEVKELLSFGSADTYLTTAKRISEKFLISEKGATNPQLQTLALPTSNEQPENFPFVVIQGENTQLTVSRREILFTYIINEALSLEDAAKASVNLKNALFEDTIVAANDVRVIEAQFNNYIQKNNYTDVLKYLDEKKVLKDNFGIDSTGFSIVYSKETDVAWASNFRHEYASRVNIEKELLAIQASCALTVGGYDFNELKYEDMDSTTVELFTEGYTEAAVHEVLTGFYGPEQK